MDKDKMKEEELKAQEAETQKGGTEEGSVKAEEKELTPEEKLEKDLAEAQKTIEEQKDKYLRLSAEFDNFRKRTMKEKSELIKNGGEKAINAVLPVLDSP